MGFAGGPRMSRRRAFAVQREGERDSVRRFGELEAVVMDRLWSNPGPMSVREVLEELQPKRPLAYTTVMTVMDNLYKKDLLARERDGRAYRYQPTETREQYSAALMTEALTQSKDHSATLVHFLEQIGPDEASVLRRALDGRRRRR